MIRLEDARLLLGQGCFIDDEPADDALAMVVLRSPVAHGRITGLDVSAASAMPGVVRVLRAADLACAGVGPMKSRAPVTDLDGSAMREPARPVLASDKVVYLGQAIAVVIASTPDQALDALEVIELDIDPLPAVIDVDLAANSDAPIWEDIPDNRSFTWEKGNGDVVDARIAAADHVVTVTVDHPRLAIAPVEPRGCLARCVSGKYTLITPSQGVSSLQAGLADCMGIEPSTLRVLTRDVGGSFAVKIWPYPEHVMALVAARLTGQAVRWIGTRSEAFLVDAAGRGRRDRATLALDASGRFLAFRIDALADMGAFLHTVSPSIVTSGAVRPFSQQYAIEGQHYRVSAIFTTLMMTDAYRGAGKPESTATLERAIDVAALELGMDRLALRRLNLITPAALPYRTPMNETYDGGNFPALADRIASVGDWDGVTARKRTSADAGLLRGVGVGFHLHATGGAVTEQSSVTALADGRIVVRTGAQDGGQGHRSALGLVASEALGVPLSQITVEQGDTDFVSGGGTGGSNLLPVAANTVHRSALAMIERARAGAADLLETAIADISYERGSLRVVGTDRVVGLGAVAEHLSDTGGCTASLAFEGTHTTFPNGAYMAEVEIDPSTGHVRVDRFAGIDDLGRVLSAPSARGQIQGGIAQGIGEALMEGYRNDGDGQMLNASLMDYALPRADMVPSMDLAFQPTNSPNALLGAKGVGELSSIGAPGVIVNAVLDALAPLGVRHLDMPLTPLKVWTAIQTGPGAP